MAFVSVLELLAFMHGLLRACASIMFGNGNITEHISNSCMALGKSTTNNRYLQSGQRARDTYTSIA